MQLLPPPMQHQPLRSSCRNSGRTSHLCSACRNSSSTSHLCGTYYLRSSNHLCCAYHLCGSYNLCCSSADYNIDDCHAFLPSDNYSPFDHNNHNSCSQVCNSCKKGG